jgi:hypothetical protein
MIRKFNVATALLALIAAILFTYAWYNTLLLIAFSESLWSLFNSVLGGDMPGVASDLEFLTVLIGSGVLFYGLMRGAISIFTRSPPRDKKKQ